MRKHYTWFVVMSALILTLGVGATVAYLVSSPQTVQNTFTVGSVGITLTETTGPQYKMAPGAPVKKDPTVTVKAGSESCWLFVKVEESGNLHAFCSYQLQEGWTGLAGHPGIYYRAVESTAKDAAFPVLKDNRLLVYDTVTEEQLNAVTVNPTLKFTAYAIQSNGLDSVHDAWQALSPWKEE